MKTLICTLILCLFCPLSALANVPTWCDDNFEFSGPYGNRYAYRTELLAKARPDECFLGIGDPNNTYPFDFDANQCTQGTPKVNQAYVWGLVKAGENLWFGTAPNVHCLVMGGYLGNTVPIQARAYVCEFGQSEFVPPLPPEIGDWRPPDFFVYNITTSQLTDLTPRIIAGGDFMRIQTSLGIRSAGAADNVVFLGGPALEPFGTISLFAFRNDTGEYLGSAILPYPNIRKWLVVDGVLYTAAGQAILRWTGDVADPFQFEEVGRIAGQGAELAYYQGRIFVSTWPGESELAFGSTNAGLWMSPAVDSGLTPEDANNWVKVWDVNEYEPDPVIAATYGGGALASFDGFLYWGTMHVPFLSTLAHFRVYGEPNDASEAVIDALKCHRAISIFRGRNFTDTPEIQLLYGEFVLPKYDPVAGWQNVPNLSGPPLYGPSGFGNFFNNYTWTMAVYDDQLFVGTMDWSYLALGDAFSDNAFIPGLMPPLLPTQCFGADLYRFSSSADYAVPISLSGVGNYTNYGIRTMVADHDGLFLGTANPMNLLTNPFDDLPEGGWELRQLKLCLTHLVGDLNHDGIVNFVDFAIMANNWLKERDSCW